MASESREDFEQFKDFMKHRFNGNSESTIEDGIQAFREYQRQLNDLRAKVREAQDQVLRGDYGAFDEKEILKEIDHRLAAKGITE
jgi:hypothetical protein